MTLLIQLKCGHTFEITITHNPFAGQWHCDKDGPQDAMAVLRCTGPATDPNALFAIERATPDAEIGHGEQTGA
jgi:hypothetical protein